ncbi:hypothetical protein CKO12_13440 [Chromatium okenii]|uniref:siphovirus Gp157 family protein n=1 Tax=Chromatium okenii TaxID=61644 RepID=UPI0019070D10|nr:siphovirus Gp157 family protein [Chromatium okenii]MBK1642854.1 hypothetical protein [Chromatium okenii]
MSITLYQIADDYRDILSLMESDVDDPATLHQLVQDTLDQLQLDEQFTDKALAVACYVRETELEAEAVKATETSIRNRRKQLECRSEFLRNYLITQLQKVNKTELKSNQIVVRLRKTPARIIVDDESMIPDQFKEVETLTHIRKNWMQEKLRLGVDSIPGVHLETGVSLTLR